MTVLDALHAARDSVTVTRIFGEPYEKDGLTIIPAALVTGGAGGGAGHDRTGQNGEGGGFGVLGRPVGAYVIRGDKVTWRPAVDPNRVIVSVAAALIVYFLSRRRSTPARTPTGLARFGRSSPMSGVFRPLRGVTELEKLSP